jgi:aminomethyltransferase
LKKTPLYERHVELGGKIVDFAGWALPVEFAGIKQEHQKVRTEAGLFDVSHMGEILVTGAGAQALLQRVTVSDISKLTEGQITYTLMCYENGGVVDDLLVYKYSEEHFLLVVNASNTDRDFAWVKQHQTDDVNVENVSASYALLALQGPLAEAILQQLTEADLAALGLYRFYPDVMVAGRPALVSRTGYTGEHGFEIYLSPEDVTHVWDQILSTGGEQVAPIGLGARDTLRFEAKLPLYGQEIAEDITPLEAGLGFFVKLNKGDFIGREALLKQKEAGLERKQVELVMVGRGIPRAHYPVAKDGQEIGHVTTGSFAPTLGKNLALALIAAEYAQPGQSVDVVIRGRQVEAQVTKGAFYQPAYRRKK